MARYRERHYRRIQHRRLVAFEVRVKETDLFILAARQLRREAEEAVYRVRGPLEGYIAQRPQFVHALAPLPADDLAPPVVRDMLRAASLSGVGPMAAVAGAIAERVGRELLQYSDEVVVENGGDCFVAVREQVRIGIFAGASPLSNKLGLQISPERTPVGVCTSSGTVGHSLSLGKADAVTVVAADTALADAVATRLGNEVRTKKDIPRALEIGSGIDGVSGILIVGGGAMGAWGDIEITTLD